MTGFLTEPSSSIEVGNDDADVEEVFGWIVDLLRTKHNRENGFQPSAAVLAGSKDNNSPNFRVHEKIASLECPGLCLRHEGHLNMNQSNRDQAQEEAASLLSRGIRVEVDPSKNPEGSIRIQDLPKTLMNNMYESFAILVDSRLRVYAKVFYRHLSSLVAKRADAYGILQMGQKLETLHDVGGQITALAMQMNVDLEEFDLEHISSGVFQQALRVKATMELHVPSPTGQDRTLTIRHSGKGHLKGRCRACNQILT